MKTKHGAEFADVRKFISDGQSFTLLTHISPDGDTLGSALALKLLLNALGKTAEVVCSNPVPKIYGFLPESETVKMPEDAEGYCRVIAVDCADKPRFGRAVRLFDAAQAEACVDHHVTNPHYAEVNLVVSDAAATAEIVYELYGMFGVAIDKRSAICLYTGIVTDTGNLSYSNTTPNALRIIADFIEKKLVDVSEVNRLIYRTVPYTKTRVQGFVTSRIRLEDEGRIGIGVLTRAQMLSFDATNEDCEGIVDCVRDIDSVKIAIFIREGANGSFKVSLRSKDIGDVCRIANKFGGGGHERAAGYTAWLPLSTVVASATEAAIAELKRDEKHDSFPDTH